MKPVFNQYENGGNEFYLSAKIVYCPLFYTFFYIGSNNEIVSKTIIVCWIKEHKDL